MIDTPRLNRRWFLGGAMALVATPALAKLMPLATLPIPLIKGDGLHDDWEGLQALLSGTPFTVDGEDLIAQAGLIARGRFKISRGLTMSRGGFVLDGNTFLPTFSIGSEPLFIDLAGLAQGSYNYIRYPGGEEIISDRWIPKVVTQ